MLNRTIKINPPTHVPYPHYIAIADELARAGFREACSEVMGLAYIHLQRTLARADELAGSDEVLDGVCAELVIRTINRPRGQEH